MSPAMDRTKIFDALSDLRRRVIAPWQRGETPLELRKALLEEVVERTVPVAPGRRVLAFNRVRIELAPSDPDDAWVLRQALPTWRREMLAAIEVRLREIGCEQQRVDVLIDIVEPEDESPDDESAGWSRHDEAPSPGEGRYALHFERVDPASADAGEEPPPSATGSDSATGDDSEGEQFAQDSPDSGNRDAGGAAARDRETSASAPGAVLELEVVRGAAEESSYRFDQRKIFVGRTAEVVDSHGRLRRRNHVVFLDDDEDSASVSREHARILFRPDSGGYWLIDERSAHGTRIVRDGRSFDVSPRDRRGVRLKSGDEICLGRARLRVG